MVGGDRIGNLLQNDGFPSTWRGVYQRTLSFSVRSYKIDHSGGDILRPDLHLQLFVRIERRKIIKENFLAGLRRIFKVDGLDFDQCEVTLALFRRPDLA